MLIPASTAGISTRKSSQAVCGPGWPRSSATLRPWASNLNYTTGQTVPNAVIAPLAADGSVCFHAEGTTHLLADVNGWFATGGGFHALTPYRVFDTRS